MSRFAILDGSGFLYRAYHGFPELTNSQGNKIQAVYGFIRMICNIIATKTDYLVIVRDAPVKTLRHIAFEEYKANRPSMPDEFKRQINTTKHLVGQLWIPFLEVPGYEADDIIASLVKQFKTQENLTLEIASWDKDLKQLLDSSVICTDPMKQETTTVETFQQQFGFDPIHIVDYLALIGDSSDNIPGVAGIGPKGATDLIKQYQTIENIYDHIDAISPSAKEKLITGKENAFKSKELIILMDVPGIESATLDQFVCTPDIAQRSDILVRQYEFTSMNKHLDQMKKTLQKPVQESLFG